MPLVLTLMVYAIFWALVGAFAGMLSRRRTVGFIVALGPFLWPLGELGYSWMRISEFKASIGEENIGFKVNRIVNDVDGFLMDIRHPEHGVGCSYSCPEYLLDGTYRYLEATSDRIDLSRLVEGPGTYRFSIEEPGHPDCAVFDTAKQKYKSWSKEKFQGICLASRKIENTSSEYVFEVGEKIEYSHFIKIYHHWESIKNINTNEIVGVFNYYSITPIGIWNRNIAYINIIFDNNDLRLDVAKVLIPPERQEF